MFVQRVVTSRLALGLGWTNEYVVRREYFVLAKWAKSSGMRKKRNFTLHILVPISSLVAKDDKR